MKSYDTYDIVPWLFVRSCLFCRSVFAKHTAQYIFALLWKYIYSEAIWLTQVLSVLANSKELLDLLRKVDAAYAGHIYGRPHQRSSVLLELAPTIQEQLQVILTSVLFIISNSELSVFWASRQCFIPFQLQSSGSESMI